MSSSGPFTAWAHTTFHLSGEAEKYRVGSFATCAEAIEACRHLVDEFLQVSYSEGMRAEELVDEYRAAGPEPYVEGGAEPCVFEARSYAESRARIICE